MNKAYSYIRFSTKGQIEGRSLKRQLESAEEYANSNRLALQSLSFRDLGVSGYKGKNSSDGELGKFIEAVKEGAIEQGSYLLIESFDRMSRQPVETSLMLLMTIVDLGITVVTLMDRQVYKKGEMNMQALMISLVSMSRAHEESATKSKRVGDAWHKKQKRAATELMGSPLPAWLHYSDDKKDILISMEKAVVVKYIFLLSAEGYGKAAIVRKLNDEGILPISSRASKWHPSYITKILNGRIALGEYHPHINNSLGKREPTGEVIKDYYPAIIDESLWYKSQAGIKSRRIGSTGSIKKGLTRNIFSGFISCECGSSVQFVNKGSSPKGGYYLVCSLARYGGGCKYTSHRYYYTQWVILIALQKLLTPYAKKPEDAAKTMSLEGELITLQKQIDELIQDIDENGFSTYISKAIRNKESRISEVSRELADIQAAKAVNDEPVDLTELTGNINEQSERLKLHQHLKRQLKTIVLYPHKKSIDILVNDDDDIHLSYNEDTEVWTSGNGMSFKVDT
ncbi:recombinase family protein [Pseudoalteromonas sp. SR43-3]|uniref:recombinase family protein n=1 Tax=Pseudoalteromonas sp. SR43-3 TaxID=2760943 RepID=UPI001601382A|nr:recombinase family protein [Pseudoalteromonas sp. SR43-3]MBB1275816.1 recombinase family protein [Pseudoalteromonas sp. SR43-3]